MSTMSQDLCVVNSIEYSKIYHQSFDDHFIEQMRIVNVSNYQKY